jgi:hypothetical protein
VRVRSIARDQSGKCESADDQQKLHLLVDTAHKFRT